MYSIHANSWEGLDKSAVGSIENVEAEEREQLGLDQEQSSAARRRASSGTRMWGQAGMGEWHPERPRWKLAGANGHSA